MLSWNATVQAVFLDTALGEVLGPYGAIGFIAVAGALFGITIAVLVRGILDQIRGPAPSIRPAAVYPQPPQEAPRPTPAT